MEVDFRLYHVLLRGVKKELEPLSNAEKVLRVKELVGADNAKNLLEKLYG